MDTKMLGSVISQSACAHCLPISVHAGPKLARTHRHSAMADTVQEEVLLQRIFGLTHDIPLAFASVMLDKNHDAAATLSWWLVRKSSPKALNSLSALRQPPRTFEIR